MTGFVNTSAVVRQVERWGEGARHGARRQLRREFELILAKARDVYCPVDTGALRASGEVVGPIATGGAGTDLSAQVNFGGPDAPHAIVVHERQDVYHEPPTQAKYLERARNEQMRGMQGRIAIAARREGRRRVPTSGRPRG